ncbi:MAG: 16S rRNA (cytosine(1402)-N(4))-methyltransferase, partial [Agathobaculum butyriciproducens]
MEFHHVSILLEPCLEALQIKPDGVYVDATTGGAGHSLRIAERLHDTGRLICIDRDDEALENAKDRLKDVWQRVTPVKSDFRDIDKVLEGQGLAGADGILFD